MNLLTETDCVLQDSNLSSVEVEQTLWAEKSPLQSYCSNKNTLDTEGTA